MTIAVVALCVILVLGLGGALTRLGPWYENLRKPSWQPPGWVFAPVWTTIGILTAISAVLAWHQAPDAAQQTRLIAAFATNGVLNIAWSGIFFTLRRPDWALGETVFLWLSIAVMILVVAPLSPLAAWLLAPYLVWVSIAGVLNWTIVRLNAPFGRPSLATRGL